MSQWAAILAGGSGTRFWPLSTSVRPKQMLPLTSGVPLLVGTVQMLERLIPLHRILILTGAALEKSTRRLLPEIPKQNFLIEPRAASTAPALTWATTVAAARDPEASIISLHADWFVGDDELFRKHCVRALQIAERHDRLVTVGVEPTRPETGYGYIMVGEDIEDQVYFVSQFVEKPTAEKARELIGHGALWNSGLFAWTARRFIEETRLLAPEIAPHLALLDENAADAFFYAVTPIAVDVSHFERSKRVAVVRGRFPWDDVGDWAALARVRDTDALGNVTVGMVFQSDSEECVAWADDGAIVLDGVEGLVVVRAHGVTLVTRRERAAELKKLLEKLPPEIREMIP